MVDVSKYLVIGPENVRGSVSDVVADAVDAGFTMVQLRSKVAGARELMALAEQCAAAIAASARPVPLLIDDRLDVALACRVLGLAVDGVHVGQGDVPPEICRRYLGAEAIVGLTSASGDVSGFLASLDPEVVDYLGVGCVRPTATKSDAQDVRSMSELAAIARRAPVPVVVGGGVTLADVPALARAGVDGFFVVSAVCSATDPAAAATALVNAWDAARR